MQLRLLAILLISAVLIKPVTSVYLILDYELNKEYISLFLCENRDRPELNCNGKCYLMTKLKQNEIEKRDERANQISKVSETEVMLMTEIDEFSFVDSLEDSFTPRELALKNNLNPRGVFKPPTS